LDLRAEKLDKKFGQVTQLHQRAHHLPYIYQIYRSSVNARLNDSLLRRSLGLASFAAMKAARSVLRRVAVRGAATPVAARWTTPAVAAQARASSAAQVRTPPMGRGIAGEASYLSSASVPFLFRSVT
jgi:hypothetical protein